MSDAPAKPISDTTGKNKETLVSIVEDMADSTSNRDWRKYSVRELAVNDASRPETVPVC